MMGKSIGANPVRSKLGIVLIDFFHSLYQTTNFFYSFYQIRTFTEITVHIGKYFWDVRYNYTTPHGRDQKKQETITTLWPLT